MSDLDQDSTITVGPDGRRTARVGPEWDAFGPNGGFLTMVAVRAAATMTRPATLPHTVQCQFLRAPKHGELTLDTELIGRSTRSDVVRVVATQGDRTVLTALARSTEPVRSGVTADAGRPPEVPDPGFLRSTDELLPPEVRANLPPMTRNFEARPVTWEPSWPPPKGKPASYLVWCRFRPTALFDDPVVSVGRYLILLDSYVWAAVERGTGGGIGLSARSTDLSVTVHDTGTTDEWLLCDVTVSALQAGAIGANGAIWSRGGALLATGQMNMVYTHTAA